MISDSISHDDGIMIGVNSVSACPEYSPRPNIIACATCNMCRGSLEFTDYKHCETPNHRRKITDVMRRTNSWLIGLHSPRASFASEMRAR